MAHIIIYPSKNKEDINVNEKQFLTVPDIIIHEDVICIEDTNISNLEDLINKYKEVKTIVILLDNYGKFIYSNLEFIKKHKEINFYIHENDIHKLESKPTTFQRYFALRSILKDMPHIYILAYYWYHYQSLYSINDTNIICFPKFINKINEVEPNKEPINKILLSGSRSGHYPMRRHLASLNHPNVDILDAKMGITGSNFIEHLGKYLACFTCFSNKTTPYIINKFFEIPLSGSLLLAYEELVKEPLKSIGFIDGENYISCTKENITQKIDWICDQTNRNEIDRIRKNGYDLILSKHSDVARFRMLLKLILNEPIESFQKPIDIVQESVEVVQDPIEVIEEPIEVVQESVEVVQEPIKAVRKRNIYNSCRLYQKLYKNMYKNLYENLYLTN